MEVSVDVADEDDLLQLYSTAKAIGCVVREVVKRDWGATDFRIADPDGYFVRFTTSRTAQPIVWAVAYSCRRSSSSATSMLTSTPTPRGNWSRCGVK